MILLHNIKQLLANLLKISLGGIVGFILSFFILFLIDQFPDFKLYLLNGNLSNYIGLAFAITFFMIILSSFIAFFI